MKLPNNLLMDFSGYPSLAVVSRPWSAHLSPHIKFDAIVTYLQGRQSWPHAASFAMLQVLSFTKESFLIQALCQNLQISIDCLSELFSNYRPFAVQTCLLSAFGSEHGRKVTWTNKPCKKWFPQVTLLALPIVMI